MGLMHTKIDSLIAQLEGGQKDIGQLSTKLSWDARLIEKVARTLERVGVLSIVYPFSINHTPELMLAKKVETKQREKIPKGKHLADYSFQMDNGKTDVAVSVIFSEEDKQPVYFADFPYPSRYTELVLQAVKDEVAKVIPPEPASIDDDIKAPVIKQRRDLVLSVLASNLGKDAQGLDSLCGIVMRAMFGIGEIDILMSDDNIEEVTVNKAGLPAFVYHRKHGWLKTNLAFEDEDKIYNLASLVGRKVGKQVSSLYPLLDAHLPSGDRVNVTLFPISSLGSAITIRKFARNPITIIDFAGSMNNMSFDMAAFMWQAIHYERSMLVCGGTASGKTTTLNALLTFVPPRQRILTIEDTRELALPSTHENWVALCTRSRNPEGFGEVNMLDLLVNSLRMRPDRIVMGEIRKKEEAEVLFEAMHTGHSVYGTLHADTARQLIERLENPPFALPYQEVASVDLVVVQYRDRRKNLRRTLEVCEVFMDKGVPDLCQIFAYSPRSDTFASVHKPAKYYSLLELHTGMTEKEIVQDLSEKKAVLSWMYKNHISSVENVGRVIKQYYDDGATLLEGVRKGQPPGKVL